jgi:hypothetical protein
MNKLKYIGAVLIALAGLGLQQAKADTIYTLSAGNTALTGTSPGFSGPYATVDVHLVSGTVATVTFTGLTQTISGTTYQYLFGDSSSVAVNVNASTWTISGISGTNSGTGFTPGPFSNGGSGQVDGFGMVNQTVTTFDGFTHSSNVVTFTLTNTSGTWANSGVVLIANSQGTIAAAHIFVTTSPANASNSALVTGFAANGGATNVPDGGTTVMLLGAALGALGMARRFLMS